MLIIYIFCFLFQSSNTRSQKGEKEKNPQPPPPPSASESEAPVEPDLDSSVMDRTRKLRQDRTRKAKQQQSAEDEALHLDQLVADLRDKVEATKAAKARSAESRRQLELLQSELENVEEPAESENDSDSPVSKSDIGALVASSIKSAVSIVCFFNIIEILIDPIDEPLEGTDSFNVLLMLKISLYILGIQHSMY